MALQPTKVELRRGKGSAVGCHGCIQKAQDNPNMVQGHLLGMVVGQVEAAVAEAFTDGHLDMVQGHLPGMVVGQVEAAVAQAFTDGHREYNGDFVLC